MGYAAGGTGRAAARLIIILAPQALLSPFCHPPRCLDPGQSVMCPQKAPRQQNSPGLRPQNITLPMLRPICQLVHLVPQLADTTSGRYGKRSYNPAIIIADNSSSHRGIQTATTISLDFPRDVQHTFSNDTAKFRTTRA
ncbi:hypothetical protein EDC01DRAFT_484006 [Geopyxis carbonaria]|nr:hypothetical protein EDC01DRAFT_484006 [Geopyxis carbonaria]